MIRSLLLLLPFVLAVGSLPLGFGGPAAAQTDAPAQEQRLTGAEKKAIQEALVWAGHYEARIDGVIGPATRGAIRQFQAAEGFRATGYLDQPHLDRLMEIRRDWTDRFGWEIRRFPELGLQLGIPAALLRPPEAVDYGLRFRSEEGEPRAELRLYSAPPMSDARFDELRDELIDRDHFSRDTYDAGDPDWFVFSGSSEAGVEQYTHVVNREHGVRGFSFRYLERHEEDLARLNTALYNSLETFPAEAEVAGRDEPPPEPPTEEGALFSERELALLDEADDEPEPAAARHERASTGFLVNPEGAILTTASAIDGCERVRVNRRADARISVLDRDYDLALLEVPTEGRAYPHLSFRGEPVKGGDRLRALTYRTGDDRQGLAVQPGTVEALRGPKREIRYFRVSTELGRGSRGAPLIDEAGRVAGLAVGAPADADADADEVLPPGRRLATRAGILEAFLGAHGIDYEVAPEPAEAQQEVAPATRLSTLRIECVR